MQKLILYLFIASNLSFYLLSSPVYAVSPIITLTPSEQIEEMLPPLPTPTPEQKVSYNLPYPGLLQDSPLYPLKGLRDRIVLFFISDSVKKAQYYLFLSDKRLAAGKILTENGKEKLGTETIQKGENYFGLALKEAIKAQKNGKETESVLARLSLAQLKHAEVIRELKASNPYKKELGEILLQSENNRIKLGEIYKDKLNGL